MEGYLNISGSKCQDAYEIDEVKAGTGKGDGGIIY
jgi:hypothetical protein